LTRGTGTAGGRKGYEKSLPKTKDEKDEKKKMNRQSSKGLGLNDDDELPSTTEF
jgi:hypothetical protein